MQAHSLIKPHSAGALLMGLFLTPSMLPADPLTTPPPAKGLNLALPTVYTELPADGIKSNLNIAQQPYTSGSFEGIKTQRVYPFGYKQLKVDKSMRVRGWEVRDRLYLGQARVGDDWGVGMMMVKGNFAYGFNDEGVGLTYSGENSIYRLTTEELSFEIDF